METSLRTVSLPRGVYVRVEDVAELILEFGSTEPTDTRERLVQLARNVMKLKEPG
jgi:hypothetical protein